jgi:hypothetical protein
MVAEVIKTIQRFQQKTYAFTPVKAIQDLILKHKMVPEKECFQLSLTNEPRLSTPAT